MIIITGRIVIIPCLTISINDGDRGITEEEQWISIATDTRWLEW